MKPSKLYEALHALIGERGRGRDHGKGQAGVRGEGEGASHPEGDGEDEAEAAPSLIRQEGESCVAANLKL